MAEIVAAALTSHAPLITGKPEIAEPERRDRFYAGYREIHRRADVAEASRYRPAEHLPVLEVHRVQAAAQASRSQVLPDDASQRALALGRADQGDAARREQRLQVMAGHGCGQV